MKPEDPEVLLQRILEVLDKKVKEGKGSARAEAPGGVTHLQTYKRTLIRKLERKLL